VQAVTLDKLVHAASEFGYAQVPNVLDQHFYLISSWNVLWSTEKSYQNKAIV
jgi:hypothetical protein